MSDDKPQPIPKKSASGKQRSGPSMREQIAARKRTESEGSAQPAGKKAPVRPAPKPARAATGKPAGAAASTGRPATTRPASRGSARRTGEDEEGGTTRGRRQRPEPKKKSATPLIAAGVLLVVAVGGAAATGMFSGKDAEAAGNGAPTDTTTADGAAVTPENGDATAAEGGMDSEGSGETGTPAAEAEAAPAAEPEAKPEKKASSSLTALTTEELYAKVRALEPFAKPADVTDEEWETIVAKSADLFEDAGASSSRAKKWLIENGKNSWPAILNDLVKVDPANSDQNRIGDHATLAMNGARGSDSRFGFDWRTSGKVKEGEMIEKHVRQNLMLVVSLHDSWSKSLADPEYWAQMIDKSEAAAEAQEKAKEKLDDEFGNIDDEFGDELDGLDDLDID